MRRAVPLVLLVLAACQVPISPRPQEPVPRTQPAASAASEWSSGSVGLAVTPANAELLSDNSGDVADGNSVGVRFDIAVALGTPHVELGLRTEFARGTLEVEGLPYDAQMDLDASQWTYGPFLRLWAMPLDSPVRPYVEGWVGGHQTDYDITTAAFGEVRRSSDSQSGSAYGAGLGLDIAVGERFSIELGFDWTKTELEADEFGQIRAGRIGGRLRF